MVKITKTGYYGHALSLDKKDDRLPKFKVQRETLGFDDTETWNLDYAIIGFIQPRLRRFIEIAPIAWDSDEGHLQAIKDIREVDRIFTHCVENEDYEYQPNYDKDLRKAWKLLIKNINYLWW